MRYHNLVALSYGLSPGFDSYHGKSPENVKGTVVFLSGLLDTPVPYEKNVEAFKDLKV